MSHCRRKCAASSSSTNMNMNGATREGRRQLCMLEAAAAGSTLPSRICAVHVCVLQALQPDLTGIKLHSNSIDGYLVLLPGSTACTPPFHTPGGRHMFRSGVLGAGEHCVPLQGGRQLNRHTRGQRTDPDFQPRRVKAAGGPAPRTHPQSQKGQAW